jgi:hypothetical protein
VVAGKGVLELERKTLLEGRNILMHPEAGEISPARKRMRTSSFLTVLASRAAASANAIAAVSAMQAMERSENKVQQPAPAAKKAEAKVKQVEEEEEEGEEGGEEGGEEEEEEEEEETVEEAARNEIVQEFRTVHCMPVQDFGVEGCADDGSLHKALDLVRDPGLCSLFHSCFHFPHVSCYTCYVMLRIRTPLRCCVHKPKQAAAGRSTVQPCLCGLSYGAEDRARGHAPHPQGLEAAVFGLL